MKNLYVITLFFCVLLLQNCTLEDSLTVGLALASPSNDSGTYVSQNTYSSSTSSSVDLGNSEWNDLNKNWSSNNINFFQVPMEHGDNIIFIGSDMRSINKFTGLENWNLDIGYIHNKIKPLIIGDNMYFIERNKIYAIGLNTGELLLKHDWKSSENIMEHFDIKNGNIYVNVREKNYKYSGFASCSLEELDGGEWTYLNKVEAVNNLLVDIKGFKVGMNSQRQDIIYFTSELTDCTVNSFTGSYKAQAYNTSTDQLDWVYEESTNPFVYNEILLAGMNQVIVKTTDLILNIDAHTGQKNWEASASKQNSAISQTLQMIKHDNKLIFINGDEIATAYNIEDGTKLWELKDSNRASTYLDSGVSKNSVNFIADTLYYISAYGYLIEVDLTAGSYVSIFKALKFHSGLIVDEDENFISNPSSASRGLSSFSL